MYAKIKNNVLIKYPYGYDELQLDNPYTNFNGLDLIESFKNTDENISGAELVLIKYINEPIYDIKTQKLFQDSIPSFNGVDWVISYNVISKSSEEIAELNLKKELEIRTERNNKLTASDWTQVSDSPVDKALWATYRQALRDITSQENFPWNIDWPETP